MGLEPRGLPRDVGVDGRVGLAVGIGGKTQDLLPDGLRGLAGDPGLREKEAVKLVQALNDYSRDLELIPRAQEKN